MSFSRHRHNVRDRRHRRSRNRGLAFAGVSRSRLSPAPMRFVTSPTRAGRCDKRGDERGDKRTDLGLPANILPGSDVPRRGSAHRGGAVTGTVARGSAAAEQPVHRQAQEEGKHEWHRHDRDDDKAEVRAHPSRRVDLSSVRVHGAAGAGVARPRSSLPFWCTATR